MTQVVKGSVGDPNKYDENGEIIQPVMTPEDIEEIKQDHLQGDADDAMKAVNDEAPAFEKEVKPLDEGETIQ